MIPIVAVILSGCSVLFVHGPPPSETTGKRGAEPIKCTSGAALPIVDTLAGLAAAGAAVAMITSSEVDGGVLGAGLAGGAGGAGAAYLFSALSGYATTAKCRKAKAAQAERPATWETQPATYDPNLTPPDPAPARPMECASDVDCGVGRMCEYGQCQKLRVTQ